MAAEAEGKIQEQRQRELNAQGSTREATSVAFGAEGFGVGRPSGFANDGLLGAGRGLTIVAI